jgi:hypothetical protein
MKSYINAYYDTNELFIENNMKNNVDNDERYVQIHLKQKTDFNNIKFGIIEYERKNKIKMSNWPNSAVKLKNLSFSNQAINRINLDKNTDEIKIWCMNKGEYIEKYYDVPKKLEIEEVDDIFF